LIINGFYRIGVLNLPILSFQDSWPGVSLQAGLYSDDGAHAGSPKKRPVSDGLGPLPSTVRGLCSTPRGERAPVGDGRRDVADLCGVKGFECAAPAGLTIWQERLPPYRS
jgi:hypothetical protein